MTEQCACEGTLRAAGQSNVGPRVPRHALKD